MFFSIHCFKVPFFTAAQSCCMPLTKDTPVDVKYLFWFFQDPAIPRIDLWRFPTAHLENKHMFNPNSIIMEAPTPSSKNRVLKILFSLLLLLVMIPGAFAQEFVSQENHEQSKPGTQSGTPQNPDDQSKIMPGFRLNVVNSDAMIHGLTVGRGLGGNFSNAALGYNAVTSNTSGQWNTGVGSYALELNTTGNSNTALGGEALRRNTTGYRNSAVGGLALGYNISGSGNTAMGYFALAANTTGHNNTAVGHDAIRLNTTGFSNVAMGTRALYRNTVCSNLVAVGDSALFNNGLNATFASHAIQNTAVGSKALYSNTTGSYNTATGFQALYANTAGAVNTATGYQALYANTTGAVNTATGYQALADNTTGGNNTAVGNQALQNSTTGSENTAVGSRALSRSNGNENTGVGRYSMDELMLGSANTAIGWMAGDYRSSINYGTFVGQSATPSANGLSNITGIGHNARPTASNQVRIGNTAVTSIGGNANWTNFSDGGYKNNVEEDVAGLDFILKLRPVSYNLDAHKLASDLEEDMTRDEDGSKATAVPDEITQKSRDEKAAIRYTGFVAQEVEATVNELGVSFSGVDAPVDKNGYYGLRYADFVVPLVKAMQEQQAQIDRFSPESMELLHEEVKALNEKNLQLELRNQVLESKMDEILALLSNLGYNHQVENLPEHPYLPQAGSARLEQNTPNPFHENTVIRYLLPEGTHRAQIIVTDMTGLQVMSLPLEHQGAGQVLIHGGTLPSGTYVYTLTIDGRKVDSKRMVLL
jgi:trimeric autotransporter adhesin